MFAVFSSAISYCISSFHKLTNSKVNAQTLCGNKFPYFMRQLQIFTYLSRTFFLLFKQDHKFFSFCFIFDVLETTNTSSINEAKMLLFCGFHVKNSSNQKHSLKFGYCCRAVESFRVSLIASTAKMTFPYWSKLNAIVSFFEPVVFFNHWSLVSRIFIIHLPSENESVESECFSHENLRSLAR